MLEAKVTVTGIVTVSSPNGGKSVFNGIRQNT